VTDLSSCGCCEGLRPLTPATIANAPGLSSIAYRVGTQAAFKQSFLAAFSREPLLSRLSTRDDDDPAIALADAFATVLDVLTFYQDRIANEAYLRTATERRSVLELANSIGYELNPGVAAGTLLAFTVDDAPGSAPSAEIGVGVKAQSIPLQNQLPQTFETIESIVAVRDWNSIPARATQLVPPASGQRQFYLQGVTTELKRGDAVLIVGDERREDPTNHNWDVATVVSAETDPIANWTIVTLDRPLGATPAQRNAGLYALRQRAALFGHNAPDFRAMPDSIKAIYLGLPAGTAVPTNVTEWPRLEISDISGSFFALHLDQVYPKLHAGPDSWMVLESPQITEVYPIFDARPDARANFTLAAKTTRLEVEETSNNFRSRDIAPFVREIVIHTQSEFLPFSEQPITDPISGAAIPLARHPGALPAGRLMVVSGQRVADGAIVSEAVVLDGLEVEQGIPTLHLSRELQNAYVPASVAINANVARATHGETRAEPLGSGNGSIPFQRFSLKQTPLTFVSAPTASGASSTLEVRVNDILWTEVPSLVDAGNDERVYVTRRGDRGDVGVQFGDGITGSRLPTSVNNVAARYRVGTGLAGMLADHQISLLMSRPLGVKAVVNPLPTTGASDPESRDQARRNAPLTVLALDRIVSLQDYQDFSRAFAGIGKARAEPLAQGEHTLVHLTVGSAAGGPVEATSELLANLRRAIDRSRDPLPDVHVASFEPVEFKVAAEVLVDSPTFIAENVLSSVSAALRATFDFAHRDFAQPVAESEVIAAIQSVPGVVAVRLTALYLTTQAVGLNALLAARSARSITVAGKQVLEPAQLLTLAADGARISEMKRL
jgi:predicted phage baseplate assembly protein